MAEKHSETILLVEDDEPIRQLAAAMLERNGFQVFQASDAREAAEIWEKHKQSIDLLLADIVVPGWSGPEIAQELLRTRPDLKVIFASGYYDDESVAKTAKLIKGAKFLRKPYVMKKLLDMVRAVLDEPPQRAE